MAQAFLKTHFDRTPPVAASTGRLQDVLHTFHLYPVSEGTTNYSFTCAFWNSHRPKKESKAWVENDLFGILSLIESPYRYKLKLGIHLKENLTITYYVTWYYRLDDEWRAIARVPRHVPKIILGALLSHTLDIKIARLVLIFNVVLVLYDPPPRKKRFVVTHFETTFYCYLNLFWAWHPGNDSVLSSFLWRLYVRDPILLI